MQPRVWKVKPLQMNKIWYKRRIFRRIFQLILTIKKTLKTLNSPWISLSLYSFVFFLYKKNAYYQTKKAVSKNCLKWTKQLQNKIKFDRRLMTNSNGKTQQLQGSFACICLYQSMGKISVVLSKYGLEVVKVLMWKLTS